MRSLSQGTSGLGRTCTKCGSDLGGRYIGATSSRVAGVRFELRRWRCGCGRVRTLRREVVAR
jgi:hypothetical protein